MTHFDLSQKTNEELLERAQQVERALLSCVLLSPALLRQVECDLSDDFFLDDHRRIWCAAVELDGEGLAPDTVLLLERSGVNVAVIADLYSAGGVDKNFPAYVRRVQELGQERRFRRRIEELGSCATEDRPRILDQLQRQFPLKTGTAEYVELSGATQ